MWIHAVSAGKEEFLRPWFFLFRRHDKAIHHNNSIRHCGWKGHWKFKRNPTDLQAKRKDNTQSHGKKILFSFEYKFGFIYVFLSAGWWQFQFSIGRLLQLLQTE